MRISTLFLTVSSALLLGTSAVTASTITSLSHPAGAVGTFVNILGTGLAGTTHVRFPTLPVSATDAVFTVLNDGTVAAQVPKSAITGPISVDPGDGSNLQSPAFRVRTSADYNGDNRSDILWRDSVGGIGAWFVNEGGIVAGSLIGYVPASFELAGVGDFNGDGRSDLLWKDGSGGYGIWLAGSGGILGAAALPNLPGGTILAGIGDINDDGRDDLILRDASGGVGAWIMNGLAISDGGFIGSAPVQTLLAGVGDLNRDGKADLLFVDQSGAAGYWNLNGFTIAGGGLFAGMAVDMTDAIRYGCYDVNGDGWSDFFVTRCHGCPPEPNAFPSSFRYWRIQDNIMVDSAATGSFPIFFRQGADYNGDGSGDWLYGSQGRVDVTNPGVFGAPTWSTTYGAMPTTVTFLY